MKKRILKTIYKFGGFAPFHRLAREKALILTYHRFSREKNSLKISSEEFEAHLEYLNKHNNVLPLNELAKKIRSGEKTPPNSVAITIDDGYRDAYEIAFPILKKFNFPATLFGITDFIDGKIWLWTDKMRYLLQQTSKGNLHIEFDNYDTINAALASDDQNLEVAEKVNSLLKKSPNAQKEAKILEIAASLEVSIPELPPAEFGALTWEMAREMDANDLRIESHTVTHPILTKVDEDQLEFELKESKNRLEKELNRSVKSFCYPNGTFDEKVWKAVENAEYDFAVSTRFGFAEKTENQFLLNRVDAQPEIVDFAQTVSGFEHFKEKIRGKFAN